MPENKFYPVGAPIPYDVGPHAVSASLPKVDDVRRYGNGELQLDRAGYPRFTISGLVRGVVATAVRRNPHLEQPVFALGSAATAEKLAELNYLDGVVIDDSRPVTLLSFSPEDPAQVSQVATAIKLIGVPASSRRAEAHLLAEGIINSPFPEDRNHINPTEVVQATLESYSYGQVEVTLATSGMNAIYAACKAIQSIPGTGDKRWIQFGSLYADTPNMIGQYMGDPGNKIQTFPGIDKFDDLEDYLRANPGDGGAIMTEAPSNPLLQTPDLERLKDIAQRHGLVLVVDISAAGSATVDVSPYADVVIESLTKFASGHGDVMMGAVMLSRESIHYAALREAVPRFVEPPFEADAARLAHEITGYESRMAVIGHNTLKIVGDLKSLGKTAELHWTGETTGRNFNRIAFHGGVPAGIISFVPPDLKRFYDRNSLPKGFSFGMRRSLLTLYTRLTHAKDIDNDDGARELARLGLHPDLVRLSVGTEAAEEIIHVLHRYL